MSGEAFRNQVRDLLARHRHEPPAAAATILRVPLRLVCAQDLAVLGDLLQRVAASPALAQACAAGLLRFELCIDPATAPGPGRGNANALPAKTCCDACARGEPCACNHGTAAPAAASAAASAAATPVLRGVVTERDVTALPTGCTQAGLAPRAVLTPLARDALRRRGIVVHKPKEA